MTLNSMKNKFLKGRKPQLQLASTRMQGNRGCLLLRGRKQKTFIHQPKKPLTKESRKFMSKWENRSKSKLGQIQRGAKATTKMQGLFSKKQSMIAFRSKQKVLQKKEWNYPQQNGSNIKPFYAA